MAAAAIEAQQWPLRMLAAMSVAPHDERSGVRRWQQTEQLRLRWPSLCLWSRIPGGGRADTATESARCRSDAQPQPPLLPQQVDASSTFNRAVRRSASWRMNRRAAGLERGGPAADDAPEVDETLVAN